jgi:hypothetical protein
MMAAEQNAENVFEPPTYKQEIFATRNGSYKLFLQVHNFNGYVRAGISKQIWCDEANDYVHAKKGHCYFPPETCDALNKYLPIAKEEADRLEKQVNGRIKAPTFTGHGRPASFGASHFYQRRANGAPRIAVANDAVSEHFQFGKRHADDYKTDGSEEEATVQEQESPKTLPTDDVEKHVVPKKMQALERCATRR